MLNIVLAKKWYDKIKSGEKKVEFREIKPYWTKKLVIGENCIEKTEFGGLVKNFPKECILRCGYSKITMYSEIEKIEIWDKRPNDLETNPVYAIYLKNTKEIE